MDDSALSMGLTRLGINIESDMINRIKSMGGATSLEAMAKVGLGTDAPRLEASTIPSVPTVHSSQDNVGKAMKAKPLEKNQCPMKVTMQEYPRPVDTRIRSPPSPIKRKVPVDVTTKPGARQDFLAKERYQQKSHKYPAHQQSTVQYSVVEEVPSGDVRPNRKHFSEPDHLKPETQLTEAESAYTRPNKKHYAKTNHLDEGIPCPAEPSHKVGTRRRGHYGHRMGLVITSNKGNGHNQYGNQVTVGGDENKVDCRAERRHDTIDSEVPVAGIESSRASQSLKNIREQYGADPSFAAVPPIHWRRGRDYEGSGKENRDFVLSEGDSAMRYSSPERGEPAVAGVASPNCRGKAIHDVNEAWGHHLHTMDPTIQPYHMRGRRSVNTEEVKAEVEARIAASCGTRTSLMTPVRQRANLRFHGAEQRPFELAREVHERLSRKTYKDATKSGIFDGTAKTIQPPNALDVTKFSISAYNSEGLVSNLVMSEPVTTQTLANALKSARAPPPPPPPQPTAAATLIQGTATTPRAVEPPPPPQPAADETGLKRRARPSQHPRGHSMTYYSAIHSDLGEMLNHEKQDGDGCGPSQNPYRAPKPVTGKVGVSTDGFAAQRSAGSGNRSTAGWACLANTERKFIETRNHPMLGRPRGAPESKSIPKPTHQSDTWKSDMSSVLQHGTGRERSDKFNSPGKFRAPIKMMTERVATVSNPAAVQECAGRPTIKVRNAALTRTPWFRSSTKAN